MSDAYSIGASWLVWIELWLIVILVSPWKIFLIQLLNIAGLGPIYGPILGALYGPVALIWIVAWYCPE